MVSRFEVYLISLDPDPRGEAKNSRPGVVISPDELNKHVDSVIVAPLSSTRAAYPTRVKTDFLNGERYIVLDQIRTVDKTRLSKKIGEIDERSRKETLDRLAEMFAE
jgi:mRNA interferase MazF